MKEDIREHKEYQILTDYTDNELKYRNGDFNE